MHVESYLVFLRWRKQWRSRANTTSWCVNTAPANRFCATLPNDVGAFSIVRAENRYELSNRWKPSANYEFSTVVQPSGQNRSSQWCWLETWTFLSMAQASKVCTVNTAHYSVQKTLEIMRTLSMWLNSASIQRCSKGIRKHVGQGNNNVRCERAWVFGEVYREG